MNHNQNNIQILEVLGVEISSDEQKQPHSRIVRFSCGCIANSEMSLNRKFKGTNSIYRQYHIPCSKHGDL
jgi:hypothetical protein